MSSEPDPTARRIYAALRDAFLDLEDAGVSTLAGAGGEPVLVRPRDSVPRLTLSDIAEIAARASAG